MIRTNQNKYNVTSDLHQGTCRTINNADGVEENNDLRKLSVHQSKRLEMEIQIKVLELETQLGKEREKLFSLRKLQYANSEEND